MDTPTQPTSTPQEGEAEDTGLGGDNQSSSRNRKRPPTPQPSTSSSAAGTSEKNTSANFECNICLDQAHDAVVSRCGHLFCWPCLHQWIDVKKPQPLCPVCKSAISRESVIPLYGRGADHKQDPRTRVPPRPQGTRVEPEPQRDGPFSAFQNIFGAGPPNAGGGGSNFQVSFGVGTFPFGLFSTSFTLGGGGGGDNGGANGEGQANQNETMSKVFLAIAIFCILWLFIS